MDDAPDAVPALSGAQKPAVRAGIELCSPSDKGRHGGEPIGQDRFGGVGVGQAGARDDRVPCVQRNRVLGVVGLDDRDTALREVRRGSGVEVAGTPAAPLVQHDHRQPRLCRRNRCCQPCDTGADHNEISTQRSIGNHGWQVYPSAFDQ